MKFWQYAVGGSLALLIFSAILIADSMDFAERSTFAQNPFAFVGNSRAPFGGELEFLPTGEMIWLGENSELSVSDTERRLTHGTMALGGTFFSSAEDSAVTNRLWIGNVEIFVSRSTVLVQLEDSGMATLLAGGGSVELFFSGQKRIPFILPAHSRIQFDITKRVTENPYTDYFALSQRFKMEAITNGELVVQLWQAEEALSAWRSQFGHFAWNLPQLWRTQGGPLVRFLEKITPNLPASKVSMRQFQEATGPLRLAHERIEEPSAKEKLIQFKTEVLDTDSWKTMIQEGEQVQKEWRWFELAQKFWLPVVSPDANEQKFSVLWEMEEVDTLRRYMQSAMLLSHNEKWLRAERELDDFAQEFSEVEYAAEYTQDISRFRRELSGLLGAFPVFRTASNLTLWTNLARAERKYLLEGKSKIAQEIGHDILKFVPEFLSKEETSSLAQILNQLWFDLDLSAVVISGVTPEEQTTIDLINLVGVSGLTAEQALHAQVQAAEKSSLESQLGALLEKTDETDIPDLGISNAKKLWEFLASERIELDITSFRTTRTETELTTRFANTETEKRKIEGVFDYYAQKFVALTLGEESTSDLSAHRLGRWIKQIGGKFEIVSPVETVESSGIMQTSPQAILGRKLVQELLRSFGIEVARSQLEMLDETYQQCAIRGGRYKGAGFSAEYNLLDQTFSRITLEMNEKFVSDSSPVASNELLKTLNVLLISVQDKN